MNKKTRCITKHFFLCVVTVEDQQTTNALVSSFLESESELECMFITNLYINANKQ